MEPRPEAHAPAALFFETFGYLDLPGLFAREAEAITTEIERSRSEHSGGHPGEAHDYRQRSALVGKDYSYTGSNGNSCAGNARWHSDGCACSKYRNIKLAF